MILKNSKRVKDLWSLNAKSFVEVRDYGVLGPFSTPKSATITAISCYNIIVSLPHHTTPHPPPVFILPSISEACHLFLFNVLKNRQLLSYKIILNFPSERTSFAVCQFSTFCHLTFKRILFLCKSNN